MYIPGKGRYNNYTSRYDVYLFTLRDYVEMLLDKFNGRYIERSDMPIHSGYLLEFVDIDAAVEFISAISESKTSEEDVTTYVLPHLDGNTLPLYATTKEGVNAVYIGLSEYKEALDKFEAQPKDLAVPTVEPETATIFDYDPSDLQENLAVEGFAITGTLKFIDSGALVDAHGAGNFMAIKFVADDWEDYDSVKVGMNPSATGMDLVEIIDDPDKNGAFKVTDQATQKFRVVATKGTTQKTVDYDLSGLTLLSE